MAAALLEAIATESAVGFGPLGAAGTACAEGPLGPGRTIATADDVNNAEHENSLHETMH